MADEDVCVLIPTYEEGETIADVVAGFRDQGFDDVLVIDGGSTDGTRAAAERAGARVEVQTGTGKGQAVREAVRRYVDRSYVLMLDGDATYRPDQADRILEPLLAGDADHVIGNRFADMQAGAMTRLNRVGNRIINLAFRLIHGENYRDVLSGYRAFRTESFRRFALTEDGFGIETELAVECAKHGVETAVVGITYEARPVASEANLRPFRDGADILVTIYKMAKTNNPMFYFGSIGASSTLLGLLLAGYVAYDWLVNGVSHEVIALLAASGMLFGVQLLIFGVLSDMIVALNREQTRQFEEIARRLREEEVRGGAEGREGATTTAEGEPADVGLSEVDPRRSG
jgi:dolichol-phosphate mannosyltransferase